MTKPVILTGLRANNILTIGNYFGAMLPIIEMAKQRSEEYQVNMFIPDLHSFTTPINHGELQEQVLNNARLFAAAGLPLDNDNIHIYRQSYVPAHSELTWILDCFTGYGEMARMTQFKEKSGTQEQSQKLKTIATLAKDISPENIAKNKQALLDLVTGLTSTESSADRTSVGLFNYPVLMAADILLYDAKYVPVGDDQTQHLEFARDIAERMNKKFNNLFTIPEPVQKQHEFFGKDQGLRIKDLADPSKKMSKSDETGKGVIFLTDTPQIATKKIMSATTDDLASIHYDTKKQPGISNLLLILSLLRGEPLLTTEAEFKGRAEYGEFKKVVAQEVSTFLTHFQTRLAQTDTAAIIGKLEISEVQMNKQANQTLLRAQQEIGLRPKAA